MNPLLSIFLTLSAGSGGGILAWRLKLPGGVLVGALVGAGTLHALVSTVEPLSHSFRTLAQIAIGGVIGLSLTRSPFRNIARILMPVGFILLLLIGGAIGLAFGIHTMSGLTLTTALFSFAPGGAMDMASAALKMDADVGFIASVHVLRQIVIFIFLTTALARFMRRPGG